MPVQNIIPGQKINPEKLERARELRRAMTSAEKMLWQELRGTKLGVHFRRQQIIAGFMLISIVILQVWLSKLTEVSTTQKVKKKMIWSGRRY